MKRVRKAWNGGSRETAMESAMQRRAKLVEQGASYCEACSGTGGVGIELCDTCRGAGTILPPGGLKMPAQS